MLPELQVVTIDDENAGVTPQDREKREANESQSKERTAREKRRAAERQERDSLRKQDRARREQDRKRDQDRRDDPDWPQRRRVRGQRQRDTRGLKQYHSYALLSWAGGDYDFKDGRGFFDNTGNVFRFRTGARNRDGTGGGLDLKFYDPKHDLYEQTPGQTGLEQLDVYMFVATRVGDGPLRMPIRFGPYYDLIPTEQNSTSDYTRFYSLGVRLELEPQFMFIRRRGTTVSLYANFSVGGHVTRIDDEITDDDYHSVGTTIGFEPGIRLIKDEFELSLSYHSWDTAVRKSNYENNFAIPRTETEFRGFQLTVGWHF